AAINNATIKVCPGNIYNYTCLPEVGWITHWSVQNAQIVGSDVGNTIAVNFNPNVSTSAQYIVTVWYERNGCESLKTDTVILRDIPDTTVTSNQSTTVCGSSTANYSVPNAGAESYIWSIIPATAGSITTGQNTNNISVLWNQPAAGGFINARIKVLLRKCSSYYSNPAPYFAVNIIDYIDFNIATNSTNCASNFNASINMLNGTGVSNILWDFGDGKDPVNTSTTNVSYNYGNLSGSPVTFNVTATVTGSAGCNAPKTKVIPVTIISAPMVTLLNVTTDLNICYNLPSTPKIALVTIQAGFGGTNTIQWFKDNVPINAADGGNDSAFDFLTAFNVLGVGNYYVMLTNSNGCTSESKTIRLFNKACNDLPLICNFDFGFGAVNIACYQINANIQNYTVTCLPIDEYEWTSDIPSSALLLGTNTGSFNAYNVPAGFYNITLKITKIIGGVRYSKSKTKTFTVPFKVAMEVKITCDSLNNAYYVDLIDNSQYVVFSNPHNVNFFINGNWHTATINSDGKYHYTFTTNGGNYQFKINVFRSNRVCESDFTNLYIPPYPYANFTIPSGLHCKKTPIHFTALDNTAGNTYHWDFGDQSYNLQKNPDREYDVSDSYLVTLTVTNKFGCSATLTKTIQIADLDLKGKIVANKLNACAGSTIQMKFDNFYSSQLLATQVPAIYYWYKDFVTLQPFAVTYAPTDFINVTASGQYFAYVTADNGCRYYQVNAASAIFIPPPPAPKIKAPLLACISSEYKISIPASNSLQYVWTLNGVIQPQWQNMYEITETQGAIGNYTYSVTARVQDASGNWCNGTTATATVGVVALPNTPQIAVTNVVCNPYLVEMAVSNPQAGVTYHWSNGGVGTTTTITHDGPIQVQAYIGDCMNESQIKLPTNLEPLRWIFPTGCFEFCDKQLGYLTGPLGKFEKWVWQENAINVGSGAGYLQDFHGLQTPKEYSLFLDAGICDATFGTANITTKNCYKCKLNIDILQIRKVDLALPPYYVIGFNFINNTGNSLDISLNVPSGVGYFILNAVTLIPGPNFVAFNFYPTAGFILGTLSVNVVGTTKGSEDCSTTVKITFPALERIASKLEENTQQNENLLLLAPNPTTGSTAILYEFADNSGNKSIEIIDMIGRNLQTILLVNQKGVHLIDVSSYAVGTYNVVTKNNHVVIKSAKLLKTD
ncbi:MAG: T9SS type A sorting domain-containing protein, partial [Flavobacterium sp.]|nr:T9SS type A sorting domain-containing protein [Flavobacterium sp.]